VDEESRARSFASLRMTARRTFGINRNSGRHPGQCCFGRVRPGQTALPALPVPAGRWSRGLERPPKTTLPGVSAENAKGEGAGSARLDSRGEAGRRAGHLVLAAIQPDHPNPNARRRRERLVFSSTISLSEISTHRYPPSQKNLTPRNMLK